MPDVVDVLGQRFGYLIAVAREGNIRRFAAWRCKCDCGQEVVVRSDKLRFGLRKACAVAGHRWYVRSVAGLTNLHPSEYSSWRHMHARCAARSGKNWRIYGLRKIKVCKAWKTFAQFLKDMGSKPTAEHTIDRIENDLGYEPSNCRWATREEQQRNRRNIIWVEYEGARMRLTDVLEKCGLPKTVVRSRLTTGWSLEDALSIPVRSRRPNRKRRKRS